ncbi:MAG: hypothetical protein DI604_20160 [Delftia acidovorans]|nr:MAG: hypothetical protein DI604_20160 [Delftia acidovorans]
MPSIPFVGAAHRASLLLRDSADYLPLDNAYEVVEQFAVQATLAFPRSHPEMSALVFLIIAHGLSLR